VQLCQFKASAGFVWPHREARVVRNIVKNIQRRLKLVWLAGLVSAWLLGANVAAANTVGRAGEQDISIPGDGAGNLPASDLSGWFFILDNLQGFPSTALPQPDLSQPWTSANNIATMNYWLSLVMELGDNPSLLPHLYGLGMTDLPAPATQLSQSESQQSPGNAPEPFTGGLLGGGLALLWFYAAQRARRIRRGPVHRGGQPPATSSYGRSSEEHAHNGLASRG